MIPGRLGEPLHEREEQILFALADGMSNVEIAAELFLSVETIKTYRKSLNSKLGAKNGPHAVALAYHSGILRPKVAA